MTRDDKITTDISLQETDTHRLITRQIILRPDITQSHHYQDSNETNTTSMRQDRQLLQRKKIPWPCLFKNNFNDDFIRRNNYRLTRTTEINDTATPTLATIPYIKSMYDNIWRILQPFNIYVVHKPITTLRQLPTNFKDKDEPKNRQGTVYEINYSDCQAPFIGETGRNRFQRVRVWRNYVNKQSVDFQCLSVYPGASSWDL